MVEFNVAIPTITLNVNDLNIPVKRQRFRFSKVARPKYMPSITNAL